MCRRRVLGVRRHGRQARPTANVGRGGSPRGKALRLGEFSHRSVVHRTLSQMLNPRRVSALAAVVARVTNLTRVARVTHVAHLTRVPVIARVARIAVIASRRDRGRSRVKPGTRAARSRIDLPLPLPQLTLALLIVTLLLVAVVGGRMAGMRGKRRGVSSSWRVVGVCVAVGGRSGRVPIRRVSIIRRVWRPVRVIGMLWLIVVGSIAPVVGLGRRTPWQMVRRVRHSWTHLMVRRDGAMGVALGRREGRGRRRRDWSTGPGDVVRRCMRVAWVPYGGQWHMRSMAMGSRRSSPHTIVISARLPVRPDSRDDLDVREIRQLLGQRQRICAVALGVTLQKCISWDVSRKAQEPDPTHLGRVRHHVKLLDLSSLRVRHAGRIRLLHKRLGPARWCGRLPVTAASIRIIALRPPLVRRRVGARRGRWRQ